LWKGTNVSDELSVSIFSTQTVAQGRKLKILVQGKLKIKDSCEQA
jgi:hypothetical protein